MVKFNVLVSVRLLKSYMIGVQIGSDYREPSSFYKSLPSDADFARSLRLSMLLSRKTTDTSVFLTRLCREERGSKEIVSPGREKLGKRLMTRGSLRKCLAVAIVKYPEIEASLAVARSAALVDGFPPRDQSPIDRECRAFLSFVFLHIPPWFLDIL